MIFAHAGRASASWLAAILCCACAAAPRPTAASLALQRRPRAVVEGRVRDRQGHPVSGIVVLALPRGRDIGWSPPAVTDAEGRFLLVLLAPAEYGFLLRWEGRTVVTPGPTDPARLDIAVSPGERKIGIEIVFLRDDWDRLH